MIMKNMAVSLPPINAKNKSSSRIVRKSAACIALPDQKKKKIGIRLDPLKALEPGRKILSMIESQRIMNVLVNGIKRTEICSILLSVIHNLDNYRDIFGPELVYYLEIHLKILERWDKVAAEMIDLMQQEELEKVEEEENPLPMPMTPTTFAKHGLCRKLDITKFKLNQIAKEMQHSCKNVLRAFDAKPYAITTVLKDFRREPTSDYYVYEMEELRKIVLEKLLTTPYEQYHKDQFMKQIFEKVRKNTIANAKLEVDLAALEESLGKVVHEKDDRIRELYGELQQMERLSDEYIRRTKTEAEKQELMDVRNTATKMERMRRDKGNLDKNMSALIEAHRKSEYKYRMKKFKYESMIENWIQRYDQDMSIRQDEIEEISAIYKIEKAQLEELEAQFSTLNEEYQQIMEERRIIREKREAQQRELGICINAAILIQAFWRSYKVRKALKNRKTKKKKGKKGKGKKKKK